MTAVNNQDWQLNYIQPLFEKYESVPTNIKYALIEKDFIKMYGKKSAREQMKYMYEDSESFIIAFDNANAELSDTIKVNIIRKECVCIAFKEYPELLKSGMFWEFFPQMTGDYKIDQKDFERFVRKREFSKDYIKLIIY